MKSFLWLFLAICPFLSCNKLIDEIIISESQLVVKTPGFVDYTIRKGNHFSDNITYKQLHQSELRFQVLFDSSAVYNNIKPENQYDINKLYGFSDCSTLHHENSARFGWRWNGRAIEIHAYWYNDSVRYDKFLDTVSIGNTYELSIKLLSHQYGFEIKKETRFVPRYCSSKITQGYKLLPYFGGDESAPHDITIRIKEM